VFRTCATWILPATLLLAATGSIQIDTNTLPSAAVGVSYSQPIATSGLTCSINTDVGTASSTIDSGSLPSGLSVSSSFVTKVGPSWSIQGVPTAGGNYSFTLHVKYFHAGVSPFDPDCTAETTKALSITVSGSGGGGPVGGTTGPVVVSRTQVATTYHLAQLPPAGEDVQVTSTGAAVAFSAQATTNNGGPWLSVSPISGTTPATITLGFSVSGLTAGIYSGNVTLTSGGTTQAIIGVSLTVVSDTGIVLQVAPGSATFTATTGGTAPAPQTIQVKSSGSNVLFSVGTVVPANSKWLSITPTAALTPATLTLSADPKGLTPGTYTSTVTLTLNGVTTPAQTIPVTLTVTTPPALPTINTNGVLNAGSSTAAIAPGTWVSIFGANLSATTRSWGSADFVGGKLPTSLDNVSVTIDGRAAAIAYVSPTQLNVLAPDDLTTGLVFVQVKAPTGTSDTALILQQTVAPSFFTFHAPSTNYVAGTHANNAILAGTALVQQGILGTPAVPGETIVLYGTGFGATQPLTSSTALVNSPLPLANPQDLRVRIGGMDSTVVFAGLVSPGLYQFNVVVPNVPNGDQLVTAEMRGLTTQAGLMLSVQR